MLLIANGLIVTGLNTAGLFIAYQYVYKLPLESVIAMIPTRIVTNIVKGVMFAIIVPLLVKGLKRAKLM